MSLGGGEILVGGNFQGKGPERNALRTFVGAGVSISADTIEQGNGGMVIVWADEVTRFFGEISARGGADGGDGGFVETSGRAFLDARGRVNAGADRGAAGVWLLDPYNITIVDGSDVQVSPTGTATTTFTPTGSTSTLTPGTIVASLNLNTNVIVSTVASEGGTGSGQQGDIVITDAILSTNTVSTTLTFKAEGSITSGAGGSITGGSGGLHVVMQADDDIIIGASIDSNGGNITIVSDFGHAGPDIADTVGSGSVTINAALISDGGEVVISGVGVSSNVSGTITTTADSDSASGGVQITAGGTGTVVLAGAIDTSGADIGGGAAGGAVTITTTDGVVTVGAITTTGGDGTSGGQAGTIDVTTVGTTRDLTLNGTLTALAGTGGSGSTNTVTLTSTGAVVDGNGSTTNVSGGLLVIYAATGIDIDTAVASLDVTNATSGNIDIAEADDIQIVKATQTTAGDIQVVTTDGGITVSDGLAGDNVVVSLVGSGQLTLTAQETTLGAGDITLVDDIVTVSGQVLLTADDRISFGSTATITSTSGNVTLQADDDDAAGDNDDILMVDGSVIDAGSGTISLDTNKAGGSNGGSITVGRLVTTNTSATSIVLDSLTSVVDGGDTGGADIASGGRLVITSRTGVGSAGAIETAVASLDVTNATSGNIDIAEADDIGIVVLNAGTGNVLLTIMGAGTVTDSNTDAFGVDTTINVTANTFTLVGNDVESIETDVVNLALATAETSINEARSPSDLIRFQLRSSASLIDFCLSE